MTLTNTITNIFQRLKAAWTWDHAYQLSVHGKHKQALEVVRFSDEVLRRKLHWRLFEIQQLGLQNEHVGTLAQATSFIDELSAKQGLTPDQQYFLAFAQWYGRVAFRRLYSSESIPEKLEYDWRLFLLADISPKWMRIFPMSIHPEWGNRRSHE